MDDGTQKLRTALQKAMARNGDDAAMKAEVAMPFERPSRVQAEAEGIHVRVASVLIVIFPLGGQWHLALMQRTAYDGVHSGQVSVPGGEVEATDADLLQTALREFEEEMGVKISESAVIGRLSERYIPPSHFAVTPFVACISAMPEWNVDSNEVAAVLMTSVEEDLCRDGALQPTPIVVSSGVRVPFPAYDVQGQVVWGATALILTELAALWKTLPPTVRKT